MEKVPSLACLCKGFAFITDSFLTYERTACALIKAARLARYNYEK